MTTLCENEHVVSSQLLFDYIFLHFLCIPLVRSNLHCYNGLVTSLSYGTKRNICTTRTDTIWFINIEYNTYSTAHRRFIVSLVLNTQNILTHDNVFYFSLRNTNYGSWNVYGIQSPEINSLYIEFVHKCKVIPLPDNHDHTDLMWWRTKRYLIT